MRVDRPDMEQRADELLEWFERYEDEIPLHLHNYVNLKTALRGFAHGEEDERAAMWATFGEAEAENE